MAFKQPLASEMQPWDSLDIEPLAITQTSRPPFGGLLTLDRTILCEVRFEANWGRESPDNPAAVSSVDLHPRSPDTSFIPREEYFTWTARANFCTFCGHNHG